MYPLQVDKGVVPLAGTDGETTTQGTWWVGTGVGHVDAGRMGAGW